MEVGSWVSYRFSTRASALLHTTQQCTGQIWMLDFYGGTSCGAPRPAALHASRGRREGTCMRQRDGRCLPLRVPLLLLLLRRRVNGRSFRANSFREFTTAAASHEMNGSRICCKNGARGASLTRRGSCRRPTGQLSVKRLPFLVWRETSRGWAGRSVQSGHGPGGKWSWKRTLVRQTGKS